MSGRSRMTCSPRTLSRAICNRTRSQGADGHRARLCPTERQLTSRMGARTAARPRRPGPPLTRPWHAQRASPASHSLRASSAQTME